MVATHFGDFKLRWKLAIIFTIIPIIIFYFSIISNIRILDYLNLINLPAGLLGLLLFTIFKCDGLGCIIVGLYFVGIGIILFYGGIGYLIGYYIEKRRNHKSKKKK